ncbi:MAG: hypothetical protein ACYTKD_04960 [Planctomycetota bacterium]|jgi:hypothetical protein
MSVNTGVLRGRITNEDYTAFSAHVLKRTSYVTHITWAAFLLSYAAAFAACRWLRTPEPTTDALALCAVGWASAFVVLKAFETVHRRNVRRYGFQNVGDAAYELGEESLRFTGTSFACDIPYTQVLSVIRYSGRAAILFTPLAGFLLPAEDTIMEGDFDSFISELQSRTATQPSKRTGAAGDSASREGDRE